MANDKYFTCFPETNIQKQTFQKGDLSEDNTFWVFRIKASGSCQGRHDVLERFLKIQMYILSKNSHICYVAGCSCLPTNICLFLLFWQEIPNFTPDSKILSKKVIFLILSFVAMGGQWDINQSCLEGPLGVF